MEVVRNTQWYLSAVKAKLNITSDYALAKALNISRQLASKYARGQTIPGPVVAFRVAEILGEQPAAVIVTFETERAERDGRADEADELRGWMSRLASIVLAAGIGILSFGGADLAHSSDVEHSIHRIQYVMHLVPPRPAPVLTD